MCRWEVTARIYRQDRY